MAEAAVPNGRPPLEIYLEQGSRHGLQWTALRRTVLRLLWRAGDPIGVYDAAAQLSVPATRVHPMSVYRVLHCLQACGLVLPVHSWKQYLLAPDPAVPLWGLLLCDDCRRCIPVDLSDSFGRLGRKVREAGFRPSRYCVECQIRCDICSREGRSAARG